jgi:hypothetical protein
MYELDLHGVKHQDADREIENFIFSNQNSFPLKIICGNSVKMVEIAKNTLERIGCEYSMYRFGVLVVGKFK